MKQIEFLVFVYCKDYYDHFITVYTVIVESSIKSLMISNSYKPTRIHWCSSDNQLLLTTQQ